MQIVSAEHQSIGHNSHFTQCDNSAQCRGDIFCAQSLTLSGSELMSEFVRFGSIVESEWEDREGATGEVKIDFMIQWHGLCIFPT